MFKKLINKTAKKLAPKINKIAEKTEPTPGEELRAIIDKAGLSTADQLAALDFLAARIKAIQDLKETPNA